MSDTNSPAAAFSSKGKGNYEDAGTDEDCGSGVPEGIAERSEAIEGAVRQRDYESARLDAASVVGEADDETVEAARDELAETVGQVDYGARPNTIAGHCSAMEDAAADEDETTVVRIAIQIVEAINNEVE